MNREAPEFESFHKYLMLIERTLISLVSESGIQGASIEKWRWDEPMLTLRWIGIDGLHRNIHALIAPANGLPNELMVDANAWYDFDFEGKARIRRWLNLRVGQVRVSPERDPAKQQAEIRSVLQSGIRQISEVGFQELKNQNFLPL